MTGRRRENRAGTIVGRSGCSESFGRSYDQSAPSVATIVTSDQRTRSRSLLLQIDDNGQDSFITEQPAENDERLLVKAAVLIATVG